jgi:hypothetical protein
LKVATMIMEIETCSNCAAKALRYVREDDVMIYACANHSAPSLKWSELTELGGVAHEIEKIAADLCREFGFRRRKML